MRNLLISLKSLFTYDTKSCLFGSLSVNDTEANTSNERIVLVLLYKDYLLYNICYIGLVHLYRTKAYRYVKSGTIYRSFESVARQQHV